MGAMRSKQYREQRHNNIILCATTVLQRAQEARPTVFYSESDVLTRWLLARWLLARWQLARWLLARVNAEASLVPKAIVSTTLLGSRSVRLQEGHRVTGQRFLKDRQ